MRSFQTQQMSLADSEAETVENRDECGEGGGGGAITAPPSAEMDGDKGHNGSAHLCTFRKPQKLMGRFYRQRVLDEHSREFSTSFLAQAAAEWQMNVPRFLQPAHCCNAATTDYF